METWENHGAHNVVLACISGVSGAGLSLMARTSCSLHVWYVFPNRLQARSRYRAENNPHGEILRKPYLYIVHISLYPLSARRTACPGACLMRTRPSFREPGGTLGIRAACPGSRCNGWHRECSADSPSCAVPAGVAGWWHAPVASQACPVWQHEGQREQLGHMADGAVPSSTLLCWLLSLKQ